MTRAVLRPRRCKFGQRAFEQSHEPRSHAPKLLAGVFSSNIAAGARRCFLPRRRITERDLFKASLLDPALDRVFVGLVGLRKSLTGGFGLDWRYMAPGRTSWAPAAFAAAPGFRGPSRALAPMPRLVR